MFFFMSLKLCRALVIKVILRGKGIKIRIPLGASESCLDTHSNFGFIDTKFDVFLDIWMRIRI